MKGITPVIAIILLLLMAVAAAGGFYFVYQGFTESGEESGTTQIESLGEQSLAQIQIESAAGGRLYVRNTGATDIDLSKSTVYVENQPVEVNRSSDTLAERERAVLKLTDVPGCTTEKCEVKISGTASTSQKVDLSRLVCSSDSDCYAGEACEGGVCVEEGGGEETDCGNGECDAGEHGYDCFEDCHPSSLIFTAKNSTDSGDHIAIYDWNGTSYERSGNLTKTDYPGAEVKVWKTPDVLFGADGSAFSSGEIQPASNQDIFFTIYDGSSWSYPENITETPTQDKHFFFGMSDLNSTSDAMVVWREDLDPFNQIYWSTVTDGVASEPQGVEETNMDPTQLSFAYMPNDDGWAVFANVTMEAGFNNQAVKAVRWNDGWETPVSITSYAANNGMGYPSLDFASNGDGMATWLYANTSNYWWLKYATYEDSSSTWTYQGNFDDSYVPVNDTSMLLKTVKYDHQDVPMMSAIYMGSGTVNAKYFKYEGGSWGGPWDIPNTAAMDQTLFYDMPDGTLFAFSMNYVPMMMEGRSEFYWAVWDGTGWSDFTVMGE